LKRKKKKPDLFRKNNGANTCNIFVGVFTLMFITLSRFAELGLGGGGGDKKNRFVPRSLKLFLLHIISAKNTFTILP
jgi:hypothetical protein